MDFKISLLVGYFKQTNAFLVYAPCPFIKLFTINGVYTKAFGKLRMA